MHTLNLSQYLIYISALLAAAAEMLMLLYCNLIYLEISYHSTIYKYISHTISQLIFQVLLMLNTVRFHCNFSIPLLCKNIIN